MGNSQDFQKNKCLNSNLSMQYLLCAHFTWAHLAKLCALCFFAYSSLQDVIPFPALVCRSLQGLSCTKASASLPVPEPANAPLVPLKSSSSCEPTVEAAMDVIKIGYESCTEVLHPMLVIGMTFFFLNI